VSRRAPPWCVDHIEFASDFVNGSAVVTSAYPIQRPISSAAEPPSVGGLALASGVMPSHLEAPECSKHEANLAHSAHGQVAPPRLRLEPIFKPRERPRVVGRGVCRE
jgi:hypothetical protein